MTVSVTRTASMLSGQGSVSREPLSRHRLIQATLVVLSVAMLAISLYLWFSPVTTGPATSSAVRTGPAGSDDAADAVLESDWKSVVTRRRLFYPLAPLPTRGVADKTVERIKERLALNAILEQDGKLTAYIYVKGLGVKACEEGTEVEGLFKVIRIEPPIVELEIVGHRIRL